MPDPKKYVPLECSHPTIATQLSPPGNWGGDRLGSPPGRVEGQTTGPAGFRSTRGQERSSRSEGIDRVLRFSVHPASADIQPTTGRTRRSSGLGWSRSRHRRYIPRRSGL